MSSMKKLMILGASAFAVPVVEKAKKLGIYTITVDYLPDNIAHRYSNQYINLSIVDKEKVLEAAIKNNIDGIISFACDPGVVTAAYVAEKMGLPNVGPYESVCILQNKIKFRKFLEDNGFNVPRAKGYKTIDDAIKDIDLFSYPVIVKPADSAGSKGVSKVCDISELVDSIKVALTHSRVGEFIIEEYIQQRGYASDSDCFSVNGELKFVSYNNQIFDENAKNPFTPAAYCWPTYLENVVQEELTSEIQRLLSLLQMKTSVYNIESRIGGDGKTYLMEVSPRGGGNRLSECIQMATGVDLIDNIIRYSVGLELGNITHMNYDGYWAEIILHSDREGLFEDVKISTKLREYIKSESLWVRKGCQVGGFESAREALGTIIMRFDDKETMEKVLFNQNDYINVVVK